MWRDVTEMFSEERRHYKDTYLEIDEVYDDNVEVSLFSREKGPYEIYFTYGIMYGIVYAEADKAYEVREKMKSELVEDYESNKNPNRNFINSFAKKYNVELPNDIFFDTEAFLKMFN
jgi:hypothetical protein